MKKLVISLLISTYCYSAEKPLDKDSSRDTSYLVEIQALEYTVHSLTTACSAVKYSQDKVLAQEKALRIAAAQAGVDVSFNYSSREASQDIARAYIDALQLMHYRLLSFDDKNYKELASKIATGMKVAQELLD